jgi:hypothetical protein
MPQHLRFHYEPRERAWLIDCPEAPKPAQLWWLRRWALEPKRLTHLLSVHADEAVKTEALLALQRGHIKANILGPRLDGLGDIKLLDVPRASERSYV